MDTLYIGDIPEEYHFAIFNNNYIDLYNSQYLQQGSHTFYRVYLNHDFFYYDIQIRNVGINQTVSTTEINVSNSFVYRNNFDSIVLVTFIIAVFGVWLFNLITSCIRKGGLLGGLL